MGSGRDEACGVVFLNNERGHAYVVGSQGRLIAHPDISLVLRNTDLSGLPQVQAASNATDGDELQEARDTQGRKVLTAHARVAPLRWLVFVELPVEEAYAPLYESIKRSGVLLFGALFLAALAGMFLARKMVVPIQALREGAERIGAGDLTKRISVKTGDELEALADQFNDMAGKLEGSYADLEQKVEERNSGTRAICAGITGPWRGEPRRQLHSRPRDGALDHCGEGSSAVCH